VQWLPQNSDGYDSDERLPFWESIKYLSDRQVCYDVIMMSDGDMRDDTFSYSDIERYPVLILPDCTVLTKRQADTILSYIEDVSNSLIVFGDIANNIPSVINKLQNKPNVVFCANPPDKEDAVSMFGNAFSKVYKNYGRIEISDSTLGFHTFITDCENTAIHVLNYGYDDVTDCISNIDEFSLTVYKTGLGDITVHSLNNTQRDSIKITKTEESNASGKEVTRLIIKNMPVYAVFEVEGII
jgi:hypothetical protein